jgi:hypothetical protein
MTRFPRLLPVAAALAAASPPSAPLLAHGNVTDPLFI